MKSLLAIAILLIASVSFSQTLRFEAENANLFNVVTSNSVSGFSGTGYVTGFDNQDSVEDYFQLNVNVPEGLYEMWVGYRSQYGPKGYDYTVNGISGSGTFDQSSSFSEDYAGVFDFAGGTTSISLSEGWGFYDVDYIEFRSNEPIELLPVQPTLVNPNANLETRQLMSYLVSQYGSKSLSAQHHQESKNLPFPGQSYLNKSGGLTPAMRSSDFMEYSPSRVQFGANPNNETEQTIQWAQQTGGTVSMMWHWNAPTDLVNQSGSEWWRGFYSYATTFDLPGALANPNGSDYQLILRDIDAIAGELQKFEDAGVPVVWHPLHEAAGGWFWWGDHGPEAFKELWQLTYDRMTNVHGLDNLIWEYSIAAASSNGFNEDWYPGDEYVDIVGLDIYTDPSSNMTGEWNQALELFNGNKMIALSESGTLPDADQMEQYGTKWSYFAPWKGSFIDAISAADLQATLGHEGVITLDELPLFSWSQAGVAGDFNLDGNVDAADYTVWRDGLGEVYTMQDYDVWLNNFGASSSSSAQSIPEPSAFLITCLGILVFKTRI